MRVLLVDTNMRSAASLTAYLASEGARVEATDTGEEALALLRHYEFDIMVLNLTLPDMDGSALVRRMRQARDDTPVLALSPLSGTRAKLDALAAGADDAVAYSTDSTELLARMRAIIRRSRGFSQPSLQLGKLTLNVEQRELRVDRSQIHLTNKEFDILHLLMMRRNMVLTKEAILNQIYGGMDEPEPKIIDVFVCKLRKKLAAAGAPDAIGTVWGRGYTIRDAARDGSAPVQPTVRTPTERLPSTLVAA